MSCSTNGEYNSFIIITLSKKKCLKYYFIRLEIVKVIQIEKSKINESVIFVLEKPIEIGTAKLSIEFDGVINESSNGFYKNKCLSRDGNVIFSAATQFEVLCRFYKDIYFQFLLNDIF